MSWEPPRDPMTMTDYEASLALEYEIGSFAAGVAEDRPEKKGNK